MAAIWRTAVHFRAAGLAALSAVGLMVTSATADDTGGSPPNYSMFFDSLEDNNPNPLPYSHLDGIGTLTFGTHILGDGSNGFFDEIGPVRERIGWRYLGQNDGPLNAWSVSWDCVMNEDPFVDATINVTNNSAFTQTFVLFVPLFISPALTPATSMSGNVGAVVSDQDGSPDGAMVANAGLEAIFQGYIQGVPQLNARIWGPVPSYSLVAAADAANNDSATFSGQPGPAALTQIGIQLKFTLSAFDSATVTGQFDVIAAIPGPASLALLAVFGALTPARRRRH